MTSRRPASKRNTAKAKARRPAWSRHPLTGILAALLLVVGVVFLARIGETGDPVEGRFPHVADSPRASAPAELRLPGAPPEVPRTAVLRPTPPAAPVDPATESTEEPAIGPEPVPARPPIAATAPQTVAPAPTAPPVPQHVPQATLPDVPPVTQGQPAWRRHAVPSGNADERPRIVIVIDDMGLDRPRSARTAALPGPLTLAWLPYARDLRAQAEAARARGHELLVHVPMEPEGGKDPGPQALMTGLPPAELRRRLAANLSAFDGFVGINNHMGSRFTADRPGMAEVMAELAARGLLFLDSRTTAETKGPEMAARYRVPLAQRDVFLDHDLSRQGVAAALARVEAVARKDGVAIAIGHPHDVTTAALARWLPTLDAKGFRLVPLSAVVELPAGGS